MFDKAAHLPDRTHYKLEEVARAISDITHEIPDDIKGINCIKEKIIPSPYQQMNGSSKPLFLYIADHLHKKDKLSEIDRITLTDILTKLPEVSNFMSNEKIEFFFDAYYKVTNRPLWEPKLTSPADRERIHNDYKNRIQGHCNLLLKKVGDSVFNALDSKLSIISGLEYNAINDAYISKDDVINHFKSLNLKIRFILDESILITNSIADTPRMDISKSAEEKEINKTNEINLEPKTSTINTVNESITKETSTIEFVKKNDEGITQLSSKPIRNKKRDLLTQAIEDHIKKHGEDYTSESMWSEFCKMGKQGMHPFSYKNNDLCFEVGDRFANINLKALKGRIYRLKS